MTKTSHSAAMRLASSSLSFFSPLLKRTFSQSTTWRGSTVTPSSQSLTSGTLTVGDGTNTTTTVYTVNLSGANDTPVVVAPAAAAYSDTAADDSFAASSGTLVASDRDAGTTLSFGIAGGTVSGSTVTKTGSYGTLTLDSVYAVNQNFDPTRAPMTVEFGASQPSHAARPGSHAPRLFRDPGRGRTACTPP